MVTPEYARAYLAELQRDAQPHPTPRRPSTLAKLIRRLGR
jgi:hypothetical protein